MAESSFTYRAFISYAHSDRKWAVWLHRALERYRVPKRLAGVSGPRRIGKCFRDEEELGAAAELGPKIEKALQSSDVLIVVCSPRAAKSQWVNQEIAAFKQQGREHRVFSLIVDGTPHGQLDADGNATECFPPALKVTAAGGAAEPLAVDVRKFGRGDAVLRVISGLLGVDYDALREREVRRRRAERRGVGALFALGLLLTIGALSGGFFAANYYVEARELRSDLFAREAESLFNEGQYSKAILMALSGDPAAQATLAERVFRPEGYEAAHKMMAQAVTHGRLAQTFDSDSESIMSVALHPDGEHFLTGSFDGKARLWRIGEDKPLAVFDVEGGIVFSGAFHPDGERFLTGSQDGKARLWIIGQDKPLASFDGEAEHVLSVAFDSDGEHFLTGSGSGNARLWRIGEEKPLAVFDQEHVTSVAFHPDGKRFLTGSSNGQALLWQIGEDKPLAVFEERKKDEGGMDINSLAFHPDAQRFLTGTSRGATLWRIGQDKLLKQFHDGVGAAKSVSFDRDGKRFVTGNYSGATLWRIGDETPLATFVDGEGPVNSVAFLPNGEGFLAGSADGKVRLWKISGITSASVKQEVDAACEMLSVMGSVEFSARDFERFPILVGSSANPCARM